MIVCQNCGAQNGDGVSLCFSCGSTLAQFNAVPPNGAGYQNYGTPPYGVEQKSKLAAGLLGIFLGSLGVGRFYLGYTGLGVAQLLVTLFTCGIGALWGFVDGIMILTGSVKVDANNVPLKD